MEKANSFWSSYRYMDCYRSGLKDYAEECSKPDNQMGLFGAAWGNAQLCILPAVDLFAYPAVSLLRSLGYLVPPLPAPDQPRPQDDVDFLCYAEKRSLYLWEQKERQSIEEGLDDGLCEEYEIYSVLGEWAIGTYYENVYDEEGQETNFYLPSFLEASKPLPNNRTVSIMSTISRFWDLSKEDRRAILEALYTQKPLVHWHSRKPLEGTVRDVYLDIRALASQLHQGNRGYLEITNEYFQKRSEYQKIEAPTPAPAPIRPTAPPAARVFDTLTQDVGTLRDFVSSLKDLSMKSRIRAAIGRDHAPLQAVKSPGELDFSTLEKEPLHALARLLILLKSENNSSRIGYPQCFPWGETLRSGETIRQVLFRFETLGSSERKKILEAVLDPQKFAFLNDSQQKRFMEASEMAEKCLSLQRFREMYKAYRTSLFAV